MKNYKKDVKELKTLCDDFLSCVEQYGNECAYTDRKLEDILAAAKTISDKYEKEGC